MSSKKILLAILISNGIFLLLDRFLKFQAVHGWSTRVLWGKHFGWYPYFNYGIGFGLPVPKAVTIILTSIILLVILYLIFFQVLGKRYKPACPAGRVLEMSALFLIIIGALSNLIDRIFFGYTIDYLFVLTGYINLADVMIVAGFLIYLLDSRKKICFSN